MRYKINLLLLFTIILVLAGMIKAAGQPVTDQFQCSRELVKLMKMFSDTPHVSFQVQRVTTYKSDTTSRTVLSSQTGQFNDSVFSTDGYFIRKQGICSMVAPYTSYTIKNLLNQ